jgi:4-oxalmesaconate hydratase
MDERGIDLTVFSPRASFMAHHVGGFETSAAWAAICNELCHRVSTLYPQRFAPAAMLPQSPGVDPATCVPELTRCVEEYGAVQRGDLPIAPRREGGRCGGVVAVAVDDQGGSSSLRGSIPAP